MDSLISRQDAIDAMKEYEKRVETAEQLWTIRGCKDEILKLPFAEPEIVRCKECINHGKEICYFWSRFYGTINTPDNGFCHKAERRTDG